MHGWSSEWCCTATLLPLLQLLPLFSLLLPSSAAAPAAPQLLLLPLLSLPLLTLLHLLLLFSCCCCPWCCPHSQGRHFNFFLGGQKFFLFFNATGLLKNWKKQHFICSNLTLFIVPFFLSFFSFFSLFSFFSFFFSFFFFLGGRRPSQPPSNDAPAHSCWYCPYCCCCSCCCCFSCCCYTRAAAIPAPAGAATSMSTDKNDSIPGGNNSSVHADLGWLQNWNINPNIIIEIWW